MLPGGAVRTTNLVLFEGLPGSGKSTSGQRLALHLERLGVPARWWHEEDPGHPLYPFCDQASLGRFLADLETGRRRAVLAGVVDRWHGLAAGLARAGEVAVLDGCLFGYATLGLFRADAPAGVLTAYLGQVERALAPARPCVVYLVQPDVATALRRICDERGPALEAYWIGAAERSRRGHRLALRGFGGLVAFWAAHRGLTDAAFRRLPFPKLELHPTAPGWGASEAAALGFLGLPPYEEVALAPAEAARFAGAYVRHGEAGEERCAVVAEARRLYVEGLPGIWPRARLLPTWRPAGGGAPRPTPPGAPLTFHVASWPIRVAFAADAHGGVRTMTAGDHRWGRSDRTFVRAAAQRRR
jgi:thymidylate kinase